MSCDLACAGMSWCFSLHSCVCSGSFLCVRFGSWLFGSSVRSMVLLCSCWSVCARDLALNDCRTHVSQLLGILCSSSGLSLSRSCLLGFRCFSFGQESLMSTFSSTVSRACVFVVLAMGRCCPAPRFSRFRLLLSSSSLLSFGHHNLRCLRSDALVPIH